MPSRILLVEDNSSLRKVYKTRLELADFEVLEAETTAQALVLLRDHLPHLMLLDIMLPDKNGLTFLEEIRNNPKFKELPVILLTSLPDEIAFEKSRELSIHGYLVKDQTTPEELLQRIKLALAETITD